MKIGRTPRRVFPVWLLAAAIFLIGAGIQARTSAVTEDSQLTFSPVFRPAMDITRAASKISVDGNLDDAGWKNAARSDAFVERRPGDMTEPAVYTEVLVTYDDNNLYVGFICHDTPGDLRATMCQRDQFDGNDAVLVLLDPYGNAAWAYEFWVNPYGIQRDGLWTPTIGEDFGYDLLWSSAARITSGGYQVEMALPFSSMRFPGGSSQEWRIDFWRNRPRESHFQYSWAAYDRDEECWPCQWGTVRGIEKVKPGKGVELISSVVANQSGEINAGDPDMAFDNRDIQGRVSVGGKYALSSDITLEGTYNPDFSQIEADAAQIDVNTTIALFYPERRPFFQEGADIFRTLFNSFYTRTVWDPEYAVKTTGRSGNASIGFLSARDENSPYTIPLQEGTVTLPYGKSTVNVLRGSLSLGTNSRTGFMITDRRYDDGGYGTILSLDGTVRLSSNYLILGQFVQSFTGEADSPGPTDGLAGYTFDNGRHTLMFDGESYSGSAYIAQLRRRGRHLNVVIGTDRVSPSYRTQTGYDPWNDYRNGLIDASYTFYSDRGFFERVTPNFHIDRRWNLDGDIKWTHANVSLQTNLRFWQTSAQIAYQRSSESWFGVQFDDLWAVSFNAGSRISSSLSVGLSGRRARSVALWVPAIGNEYRADLNIDVKPIDRLVFEPGLSYVRSTDVVDGSKLFEQMIGRIRTRLQVNRELSLRLVVQYDNYRDIWDIDPLLTYRLSSFSVFYIGSTYDYEKVALTEQLTPDWRLTSRKFFMKIQYLFQT